MRSPLRERGYMRVIFGIVNSDAQNNAMISANQDSLSDTSQIFKNGNDNFTYDYLEDDYIKVDGSKYFCPVDNNSENLEAGFISNYLVSDRSCEVRFTFKNQQVSFNEITFNFGDNYPTDFTITDSAGNEYTISDNTERICTVYESFVNITSLILTVTAMRGEHSRFRLYSVNFGTGLQYENDMILDSSFDSSMSPINKELPQMNFQVTLRNEDHYFDLDNPKSILNQFDTDTEVKVYYGYQLPESGIIEWIQAARLYCYNWDSEEKSATIYAQDVLQTKDKDYYLGQIGSHSLYQLAEDVFSVMGITDYIIDPELNNKYTSNPLPRVTCKEALQIIANAAQRKLYLLRDGKVMIGGVEGFDLTANNDFYFDLQAAKINSNKYTYDSLEDHLIKVDGSVYFYPVDTTSITPYSTGYVSGNISDEYGLFEQQGPLRFQKPGLNGNVLILPHTLEGQTESLYSPYIQISTENQGTDFGGIHIKFGDHYASIMEIICYNGEKLMGTYRLTNTDNVFEWYFPCGLCTKAKIRFIATPYPNSRVYIHYIKLLSANYDFDKLDILSYPKFIKFENVQEIRIPYYQYWKESTLETISEETIDVSSINDDYTFYFSSPVGDYQCTASTGTVTVMASGAYFITVRFSDTGVRTLTIKGKKYTVTGKEVATPVSTKGIAVKWENPLIDSETMAGALGTWLKEYYEAAGEYTFNTRGNPELDVNDDARQLNYLGNYFNVLIEDLQLNFNGAFSGSVKTLRKGAL